MRLYEVCAAVGFSLRLLTCPRTSLSMPQKAAAKEQRVPDLLTHSRCHDHLGFGIQGHSNNNFRQSGSP